MSQPFYLRSVLHIYILLLLLVFQSGMQITFQFFFFSILGYSIMFPPAYFWKKNEIINLDNFNLV